LVPADLVFRLGHVSENLVDFGGQIFDGLGSKDDLLDSLEHPVL